MDYKQQYRNDYKVKKENERKLGLIIGGIFCVFGLLGFIHVSFLTVNIVIIAFLGVYLRASMYSPSKEHATYIGKVFNELRNNTGIDINSTNSSPLDKTTMTVLFDGNRDLQFNSLKSISGYIENCEFGIAAASISSFTEMSVRKLVDGTFYKFKMDTSINDTIIYTSVELSTLIRNITKIDVDDNQDIFADYNSSNIDDENILNYYAFNNSNIDKYNCDFVEIINSICKEFTDVKYIKLSSDEVIIFANKKVELPYYNDSVYFTEKAEKSYYDACDYVNDTYQKLSKIFVK